MPASNSGPLRAARAPLRKLFRAFGLDVEYVGRVPESKVPDRGAYQPRFQPWQLPVWQQRFQPTRGKTLVSDDRLYVLATLLTQALAASRGDVAECGVYQGGTARLLADVIAAFDAKRSLWLCDTFAGMPDTDPVVDVHKRGDFADTSLQAVRQYLAAYQSVQYLPGLIPVSLEPLTSKRFSFVHVDLDIYTAITGASRFFYDRVDPGGFIVYDDYGFASTPGARQAVDEFYADKREAPLVLASGQCVVAKL